MQKRLQTSRFRCEKEPNGRIHSIEGERSLSQSLTGPIMDLANGSNGQEILLFFSLSYFNMYSKEGHLIPFHNLSS